MKKIEAKIVADSLSPQGHRITTYLLTYPRFIHSELMTHRMFSKNSASSRAIPFEKMVKMVQEDPFIPIAWQKDHKGMQGTEYFTDIKDISWLRMNHLKGRDQAIERATDASNRGLTKQICNRYLEPFMWHTILCTFTEGENFLNLRMPKYQYKYPGDSQTSGVFGSKKSWLAYNDYKMGLTEGGIKPPKTIEEWLLISASGAEIHIQALAEAMWDAKNESTPNQLQAGEWHIPKFR